MENTSFLRMGASAWTDSISGEKNIKMCLEFSQVFQFTAEIQVEMGHLYGVQVTGSCGKVPAVFALSRK